MEITIAPASAADCAATIAVWQAAGLTRLWNDPQADFALALSNPTSTVLLALQGDKVVGTVMVGFDGHRGWVYYLACDPMQRGQGIGRALMTAAEDWLWALGCPALRLMVRSDNAAALGFYAALGYDVQDVLTIGRRLD